MAQKVTSFPTQEAIEALRKIGKDLHVLSRNPNNDIAKDEGKTCCVLCVPLDLAILINL